MIDALRNVRFLGFDVFGTVVNWRTSVARELPAFMREIGLDADPLDVADDWRSRYDPAMEEIRSGRRAWVRQSDLQRETLETLLRERGYDPERVDPAAIERIASAWRRLDPWPDAVAGLTRLRSRFLLGPISNGDIAQMVDLARYAALPWDAILGAEITHTYKPDPKTYLGAADAMQLAPSAVALVAAHNYDLAAASACGLRTIFVARPTEHGPGQTTDLTPERPWDLVARSLEDVATQLDC